MTRARASLGLALALAACAAKPTPQAEDRDEWISRPRAPARQIPFPTLVSRDFVYYSDLGPETIDVTAYPAEQKANYAIFASQCSRCHTLARSVNSPVESRDYWRFHAARMNFHLRQAGEPPTSPPQLEAILDFLEYDSRARKIERRREFEGLTEGLKRRADELFERAADEAEHGGVYP